MHDIHTRITRITVFLLEVLQKPAENLHMNIITVVAIKHRRELHKLKMQKCHSLIVRAHEHLRTIFSPALTFRLQSPQKGISDVDVNLWV